MPGTIAAVVLAVASMAQTQAQPIPPAKPRHRKLITVVEHLAIGAGTYAAVSGPVGWKWYPGVIATGAVAGFKEGADAVGGRDTKKQAAWHALMILVGAGAVAAFKH